MKHFLVLPLLLSGLFLSAQNDAVHYEVLQKAIDIQIEGYEAEEPEGTSVNYNNVSYSVATVRFTNAEGNYINVSLMDYSTALDMYSATTMAWAMGFSHDSSEEKAGGVALNEDMKGWESIKKKTGVASVTFGVRDRYILVIEMDGQSGTEKAKSIAKKVKVNTLP
ncbi:MAG: hypothetical protein HKN92_11590 [Chitinophagales bacterium]|nr:hypothetical protein [Chitinophagales bacterium]